MVTSTSYSHQPKRGSKTRKKCSEHKTHKLVIAINSPWYIFMGMSYSELCIQTGNLQSFLICKEFASDSGSRWMISKTAPEKQNKETSSPLLKPVVQFGKSWKLTLIYLREDNTSRMVNSYYSKRQK